MQTRFLFMPALALLVVASLLIAGCSDAGTGDTAARTTATPGITPLYSVGDIVQNPASSASTAWLILGYDAASDTYERALVYPDNRGNWGYRTDTRTEKANRLVMEKVYTEILTNTLPSSIRIVTPAVFTPEVTARVTQSATAAPAATSPLAPSITGIIPDEGFAGTNVSIKNLAGENFMAGVKVVLSRTGSTSIAATDVRTVSNKSITCTFVIPSDAPVGAWDLTVTNPDNRRDTFTNIFTVRRDTVVTATTSSTFSGTVPITYMDPPFAASAGRYEFIITGSGFKNGATVKLQKDGSADIVAEPVVVNSDTNIRCFFQIPTDSMGFWDILVTNPDKSYGRWAGGLQIRG